MSDLLTPVTVGLASPDWPRFPLVSLSAFLQTGPASAALRGNVLDTVSLSAAAQTFISTATSPYQDRSQGLATLASGTTTFGAQDYSGAAFIGQNLQNAVFNGSILQGVNFSGANLQGAKFINSLVTDAIFGQSDLRGADLSGAQDLQFDQVARATFDATTTLPVGIGNAIFGTYQALGGGISSARG